METQLTIEINFMSSKDNDENCVIHSKSDNIKVMINVKEDEVIIEELFQLLLSRKPTGLVVILYLVIFIYCICKCIKINFKRWASYLDSPDWIKSKETAINTVNKNDNKCFQYVVTGALL